MIEEPPVFMDKNAKAINIDINAIESVDYIRKLKKDLAARDKEIKFLKKAGAYFA